MRRSTQLAAVVLGGVSLLSACTGGSTGTATNHTATTSVLASSTTATVRPSYRPTPAFHPTGIQITEVAHLQKFITAYNTGRLHTALAQFSRTQPLGFSDCDYRTQHVITGHGRAQLVAWLHTNIAHHDHLTVAGIFGTTPNQPVLGVSFRRRNSDTITDGHPDGITPSLGAKVKFDRTGLITQFNNGPYGGPPNACHIR